VVTLAVLALPTASAPASAAARTCFGQPATVVGTSGPDELAGTKGDDVIVALAGDDVIDAGPGDDLVCAGSGADRIDAGAGHDRLYGQGDRLDEDAGGSFLVGDVLVGGMGDDLVVGGYDSRRVDTRRLPDTVSYVDAERGVVVDLSAEAPFATGEGADTLRIGSQAGVRGSAHDDTVVGSSGQDQLVGGPGNDQVSGGPGADIVRGEARGTTDPGDDVLSGGNGDDLVGSYAGRDTIIAGPGRDFVEAFSDSPTRVGAGGGDDYVAQNVVRGSGADSSGGAGRDVLVSHGRLLQGGKERASFHVDLRTGTTTTSTGGTGTAGQFEEHRFVGDLTWLFHGTAGPDRVWALTGGPLQARTRDGDDWLRGSARDDLLHGGVGVDEVHPSAGDDTCRTIERGSC
jgi:Ca2+-binding RTX toxin-like protein